MIRAWPLTALVVSLALLALAPGASRADDAGSAAALRARFADLGDKLRYNQFRRPLHLDSRETPDGVKGEIHAFVDHPFSTAGTALDKASAWCDILLLHLNTKSCRPSTEGPETLLHMRIGKKHDQPLDEAFRVDFVYRVAARTAAYLQVTLRAEQGPLGTHDYRIVLEAAPAEGGRTFIRLSYAYAYGVVSRLAMQAYLNTTGRDKVGFSLAGKESGGQPRYVGGMRGVVERNTMRYYLAIEAFLGALSAMPPARQEKSMSDWFSAVERFPRQLHEMGRVEYLDMKRREYSRQAAANLAPYVR
jgi:hypothetical protein